MFSVNGKGGGATPIEVYGTYTAQFFHHLGQLGQGEASTTATVIAFCGQYNDFIAAGVADCGPRPGGGIVNRDQFFIIGDVMAYLKIPYRTGMDSRSSSGEAQAPEQANNIIQDMTYVVTLKDFGPGSDKTIAKPAGYNPKEFECSCDVADPSATEHHPNIDCSQMITYGKLPNNKYMINWPKCGNDIYLNILEMNKKERYEALKDAKLHSLRFIYYLQHQLGFKNLGIADDEYPTSDKLPMIPYHRESRRLDGVVTLNLNDVANPYQQKTNLYRTGIAIGDYPIDHHHLKNPSAPNIDFVKIKVPSYNIPLGALIPKNAQGIIIAEKSISVTNIVAGASRLQPVVLTIGQAAGALAAVALKNGQEPAEVNIREVQSALLASKAYLMPYIDVKTTDPDFVAIQKVGSTGILKGTGIPYKWANQTWFYPELSISEFDLVQGFRSFYPQLNELYPTGAQSNAAFLGRLFSALLKKEISVDTINKALKNRAIKESLQTESLVSRRMVAVLTEHFLKPFDQQIDFEGKLKN